MAVQNNRNMMALKDLLAFDPTANLPATTSVAPMAQAAPQLSPTAQYINDMQTLMRGGIGKLSTGEKIGALGQILQAAGSRGATDPSAVIQNVRNQQMQKLNAQYQIAQLQRKQDILNSLPESERNMVSLLDEKQLAEYLINKEKGREQTDAEKKLIAAGIDPASAEGQRILRNVASSQGIITVTGPAGTTYVQASDLVFNKNGAAPSATIPQQAIDDLRSGKGTAEQFDQIFGKGAAKQYLGGGSGNATGGFRGR